MKFLFNKAIIILLTISLNSQAQDWEYIEDLTTTDAIASDFGTNMVFADDMLVVSWPRFFTSNQDADSCGEIVTYTKDTHGEYQEIARLDAEDLTGTCEFGDAFGEGLDFDNGRLAIGMPSGYRKGWGYTGTGTDSQSKVFITHFENGNWQLDETLVADDLVDGQQGMGVKVILEGDVLIVQGNSYESIFTISFAVSNSVYVFEDLGNGFEQTQKLSENVHLFAQEFDIENEQIVVGAFGEQNISTAGRVDVYEKSNGAWQNVQTIVDNRNINLGTDISIDGDTMAVGGVHAGGKGGVGVYTKDTNGTWGEVQFIQASDAHDNDQFGFEAELFGDTIIVGAPVGEAVDSTRGAIYVFEKDTSGNFVEIEKIISSENSTMSNNFGGNVLFNETDLLVNSLGGSINNTGAPVTFSHYSKESSAAPSFPVSSKVSGTWMPVNAGAQRISIEALADNKAVITANLNHNGENLWIVGVGDVSNNVIDFEHLYSATGATFGANFNSSDVITKDEGQAMITFSKCDNAVLTYDFADIDTGEIALTKDQEILGNECTTTTKALPNGISGAWFDLDRSGEAYTIYLFEEDGVQMATITWLTYDTSGNQMWTTGTGPVNGQTVNIAEMKKHTGANIFSGTTQEEVLGSLSMTWNECHKSIVTYDFTSSGFDSGEFNLSQLTVLDNTQCDLQQK